MKGYLIVIIFFALLAIIIVYLERGIYKIADALERIAEHLEAQDWEIPEDDGGELV